MTRRNRSRQTTLRAQLYSRYFQSKSCELYLSIYWLLRWITLKCWLFIVLMCWFNANVEFDTAIWVEKSGIRFGLELMTNSGRCEIVSEFWTLVASATSLRPYVAHFIVPVVQVSSSSNLIAKYMWGTRRVLNSLTIQNKKKEKQNEKENLKKDEKKERKPNKRNKNPTTFINLSHTNWKKLIWTPVRMIWIRIDSRFV